MGWFFLILVLWFGFEYVGNKIEQLKNSLDELIEQQRKKEK